MELINNLAKMMGLNRKQSVKDYVPTKAQYFEHMREIQFNELRTDKFKRINEFMSDYYNREYIDVENKLFSIADRWHQYINDFDGEGPAYEKICSQCLADFRELATSLTYEQEDSNVYLGLFVKLMNNSKIDCRLILEQLKIQVAGLDLSSLRRRFNEAEVNLSDKSLELLPMSVTEEIAIPYYKPSDYKLSYVPRLDDKHMHIYKDYNKYVNDIQNLAILINRLLLHELLAAYMDDINLRHFTILNNELERKFVFSYYVDFKENTNDIKTYELSSKTRENISRVVGLPFEQIVSMEPDELEKYINETFGPKHTQEYVHTMEQAEEKMLEKLSGNQLVFKK